MKTQNSYNQSNMQQTFRRSMLLLILQLSWFIGIFVAYFFVSVGIPNLRLSGFAVTVTVLLLVFLLIIIFGKNILSKSVVFLPLSSKYLRTGKFLFSPKTQKEIFEPIVADWQEEYFEALFKKDIWKARWINVRYTNAFS